VVFGLDEMSARDNMVIYTCRFWNGNKGGVPNAELGKLLDFMSTLYDRSLHILTNLCV